MTLICYSSTKQAKTEEKQSNSPPPNEVECGCQVCSAIHSRVNLSALNLHVLAAAIAIHGEENQRKDTENTTDTVFWSPQLQTLLLCEKDKNNLYEKLKNTSVHNTDEEVFFCNTA